MKAEEIRSALDEVTRETLADALSLVLAEGDAPNQSIAGMNRPELKNFAQAVMYLKENYDFNELDYLTTEADLVYVETGGRRVLLTERMNTAAVGDRANTPASHVTESSEGGQTGSSPNGGRFSNLEI